MSDLIENSFLVNVTTEFYVGIADTKRKPEITQLVFVSVREKKVLVVDNVVDTGKSLRLVLNHLEEHSEKEVKIASVHYKPWSILIPCYYGKETRSWIVFPWKRKETIMKVVKKCKHEEKTVDEVEKKLAFSRPRRELVKRFVQEIFGESV